MPSGEQDLESSTRIRGLPKEGMVGVQDGNACQALPSPLAEDFFLPGLCILQEVHGGE